MPDIKIADNAEAQKMVEQALKSLGLSIEDLSATARRGAINLSAESRALLDDKPKEGFPEWEKKMYKRGRVHQTISSLAAHTVVFDLQPGEYPNPNYVKPDPNQPKPPVDQPNAEPEMIEDEESFKVCEAAADQINLLGVLRTAHEHMNVHKKAVLYPIFDGDEVKKLKVFDPTTIRVIRDTYEDLFDLYTVFPKVPAIIAAKKGDVPRPDYTGRIVGFFFDIGIPNKLQNPATGEEIEPDKMMRLRDDEPEFSLEFGKIFYYDDELIVLFRKQNASGPDGLSLLEANYDLLKNKTIIDWLAVLAYWKSVLPTWLIWLSENLKAKETEIEKKLRTARASPGSDIIISGDDYAKSTAIRTIADTISQFGFLLDYFRKEYEASMGVFDTMFSSVGSNRATAQIQSYMFDKRIQPDRLEIERTINKRFFEPLIRKYYKLDDQPQSSDEAVVDQPERPYALPKWNWKSLAGEDAIDILTALSTWQLAMDQPQSDYVLEEIMGLPKRQDTPIGDQQIAAGKQALQQVAIQIPAGQAQPNQQNPPSVPTQAPAQNAIQEVKKEKGKILLVPNNMVVYDPDLDLDSESKHEAD